MKIIRPLQITETSLFTRASTASYCNSNGVLSYAPVNQVRLNWKPADLSYATTLIETATTNNVLHSESFPLTTSGGEYTRLATTLGTGFNAPDNSSNAIFVTETVANSLHGLTIFAIFATGSNVLDPTFSVFVKSNGRSIVWLSLDSSVGPGETYFDLSTGLIGTLGDGTVATIEKWPNGWFRISISKVGSYSHATLGCATSDGTYSYIGDFAKGVLTWGWQVEQNGLSSYYPTNGAAATRAADVPGSSMMNSNVLSTTVAAYNPAKVYPIGEQASILTGGLHNIYESKVGTSSVVTISGASPAIVTWAGHGQATGTPVYFTTTGVLPAGLSLGVVYYVLTPAANTFSISATPGGVAINTSDAGTGVHTAIASLNFNKPVDNTTYWLDTGAENRWKMFDKSVQSQTINANDISVEINTVGRIDTVAVLNIAATSIVITGQDPTDGIVYQKTVSCYKPQGIRDLYKYFFTPIVKITNSVSIDLPKQYANLKLGVSLKNTSGDAACGALILGLSKEIGPIQNDTGLEIQDYSIKEADKFGNYTVTERSFSNRLDVTVWVDNDLVDEVFALMASYRATPILYLGTEQYSSTAVYGFYKTFKLQLAYTTVSVFTAQFEGLT